MEVKSRSSEVAQRLLVLWFQRVGLLPRASEADLLAPGFMARSGYLLLQQSSEHSIQPRRIV